MSDLLTSIRNSLTLKLSLDPPRLSLNALNLWTRDLGLECALLSIATECLQKDRAQRSLQLNDTIMNELQDVQRMLESKTRQLAQKESDLKARERLLE
jgi:hypothetical protein